MVQGVRKSRSVMGNIMQPVERNRSYIGPQGLAGTNRPAGAPNATGPAPVPPLRARYRIMVVDDMSVSRGVIAQSLEVLGCNRVTVMGDARSALIALRANPVDLVLSDYLMPGMSGLDLLDRMNRLPDLVMTKFILVTGAIDPKLERQAAALGASAILWKPYGLRDLRATIEKVMGRRAAGQDGMRNVG